MTDGLLAARAIDEAMRIPCTVTEVIGMIIKLEIAVFASAVECRVVLVIARNRIRIDDTAVLDPCPAVDYRRGTARDGCLYRLGNGLGSHRLRCNRCSCSGSKVKSAFHAEI